ncbi:hypothetical protein TICRE_03190 [Tissierella creatinophila DSM 6911]|uniref:Uncharacterized protein n=1 Tax=Tissierella creatinophila DSM 6911 TaxID=1123403 RepID=A0A1U7M8L7_TISCR|nr:hypothetical protein TICRE_03190 [Tissierella creatinophila DSM 6911]
MATWKIMLGLQALTTTISLIAIIVYMITPGREN